MAPSSSFSPAQGQAESGHELWSGPFVDAHQHFWDPFTNFHPWLSDATPIAFRYGDYARIRRRYLPPDYLADSAAQRVIGSVYVETEWDPEDPVGETRYATALNGEHGLPNAIVAHVRLDAADAAQTLDEQAGFPLVRSVRHKPGGPEHPDQLGLQRTLMSDPRWREGYARLAHHGLHFDLQTPWWNLWEAALLARDFPDTQVLLNHAGLPGSREPEVLAAWHRAMAELADQPNVHVKVSGLGQPGVAWAVEDNEWIVRETIAMFGSARVMFASNFPVDGLCGTFDTIIGGFKMIVASLPYDQQSRLFCENAAVAYGIAASPEVAAG